MAMTLGGRAAEEIVFSEITTGASNDLEKVTETAKQMVMRFGMSERLGPRVFGHDRGDAVPRPRVLLRARLLGRDRARDRRRDPAHGRGGPPDREGHPHREPRAARADLEDPARARDDRRRAVRRAARGQDRGGGLRLRRGGGPGGPPSHRPSPRRRPSARARARCRARAPASPAARPRCAATSPGSRS